MTRWFDHAGNMLDDVQVGEAIAFWLAHRARPEAEAETWGAHVFQPGASAPDKCLWTDGRWSACKAPAEAWCHVKVARPEAEAVERLCGYGFTDTDRCGQPEYGHAQSFAHPFTPAQPEAAS